MATRAARVFKTPNVVPTADSKNFHGRPAWKTNEKEQLLQTLLTNTFGNTFYVDQKGLVNESEKVHTEAIKHEAFYAKALVFARNRGYMRTQPVYGLARLVHAGSEFADKVFDEVIRTPNDLNDFLTISRTLKGGRTLGGRRIKRLVGRWLGRRLGEYWAIKYGAQKNDGFSLRDMILMTHPKTAPSPLFDYLLRQGLDGSKVSRRWGKKGAERTEERDVGALKQIMAFEALKVAKTDDEKVTAVREGRLPHEVVTPFVGDSKKVWSALVPNLPIFALLKNLATLERHGVLESSKAEVLSKLTSERHVRQSKILPFRFIEADEHVKAGWAKDALRDAVEISLGNIPDIEGTTAVLLDVSPSMMDAYGKNGKGFIRQAAPMAVALVKKSSGTLVAFDGEAKEVFISARDSLLTQAKKFHNSRVGMHGGTNPSAAVDVLLKGKVKVDNLIVITDGEQNQGRPFANAYFDYLSQVNRKVKLFVIDVSPYKHAMVPMADPGTFFLYGWSDQMLNFISLASKGWGGLVEEVDKISFTQPAPTHPGVMVEETSEAAP